MPLRLQIAVVVIALSHPAIALLGLQVGGFWVAPIDLGRPILLLVFLWLTLRGYAWARWVLVVLLALSALTLFSNLLFSALGSYFVIALIAGVCAPLSTLTAITLAGTRATVPREKPAA
jgi:hypothetical protein